MQQAAIFLRGQELWSQNEVADWGAKMEEIRQKLWELGDANA